MWPAPPFSDAETLTPPRGYGIHASYALELVNWCSAQIDSGVSPLLQTAWAALRGGAAFDPGELAALCAPHLAALKAYCSRMTELGAEIRTELFTPPRGMRAE